MAKTDPEKRQIAEDYIRRWDTGHYTPVDSYPMRRTEAKVPDIYDPAETTHNAWLHDPVRNRRINLWIDGFGADFATTGTEAQSRSKKDFYPRFFTQPRYTITGQTFNEGHYNRLAKFIALYTVSQLILPAERTDAYTHKLLRFHLKDTRNSGFDPDRLTGRGGRSQKGGYSGWEMVGYIESLPAGSERFINAPAYEFQFVLANATAGPMTALDSLYKFNRTTFWWDDYMSQIGPRVEDPMIAPPAAWGETPPEEPETPPDEDPYVGPIDTGWKDRPQDPFDDWTNFLDEGAGFE